MGRFIVVNPDIAFIQGDIACDSPARAVARTESLLSAPAGNASWLVYRAPAGFPPPDAPYDGGDAGLIAALASGGGPARLPCGLAPALALSA